MFGRAGDHLDTARRAADIPRTGRLAVTVVFRERTVPPERALDDGRVFGRDRDLWWDDVYDKRVEPVNLHALVVDVVPP